jgi:transposase-like protein
MAKSLDEEIAAFRSRPLDAGPYPYLWLDALAIRVREGGRSVRFRLRRGHGGQR